MASITLKPGKSLSVFSLVMINVIAVDSLRTLPISAEYGLSLVIYYSLAALLFFVPVALVAAELATTWPQTGGLYIWIREAFGKNTALFAIWLQWIYNVIWYPTIMAFITATLSYLIDPTLTQHKLHFTLLTVFSFWVLTGINCFSIRISSLLSIVGAILGTLIPMLIITILGFYWWYLGYPPAMSFSTHAMLPDLSQLNHLVFFIGLLFGLMGIEMSAIHAGDVVNPQRDYPRALLISTIIILLSLMLSSLAIATVIPQQALSLISGLLDAFHIFFEKFHCLWLMPLMIGLIIFGSLSTTSAWIIGPTRGLLIALQDTNQIPWLQVVNRHQAPVRILITQALIFTGMSSIYLLMPNMNSGYWILSTISAQFALVVYILMFAAVLALRYKAADRHRPYRIPWGNAGLWVISLTGIVTCVVAGLIGLLPPSHLEISDQRLYEVLLLGGISLFCLPPLCLRLIQKSSTKKY